VDQNLSQDAARNSRIPIIAAFIIFLLAISLPYILASMVGGDDLVFGGFLFNPLDGNSYLAKMYQGWEGEWRFTLPYTSTQGEGSFLFLFYLLLGHMSRWTHLPLVVMYHLARMISAVLLFWALISFIRMIFKNDSTLWNKALLLTIFGSGIGWLAIPFGGFTSDFWVAEAYPFLSAYATPHFALGLAILLVLLEFSQKPVSAPIALLSFVLSFLLAIIQPFGVVIAAVVIAANAAWKSWEQRKITWEPLALVLVGGGIPLLYQFWTIYTDPLLTAWNAQNLTPAPPVWDLLFSLSPAVLFAFFAAYSVLRHKDTGHLRIVIIWLAASFLLIFFPFNLQRRFMLGMYIPAALLAVAALGPLTTSRKNLVWILLFVFSVFTNTVVLSAGVFGALAREPSIYLSHSEWQALEFIRLETEPDAVILAAPETGLLIPAYTGRRVLYGHPFETVDALRKEKLVRDMLASPDQDLSSVNYIFLGPRERQMSGSFHQFQSSVVFQNAGVEIFRVNVP
jgi:hypothetical protein